MRHNAQIRRPSYFVAGYTTEELGVFRTSVEVNEFRITRLRA